MFKVMDKVSHIPDPTLQRLKDFHVSHFKEDSSSSCVNYIQNHPKGSIQNYSAFMMKLRPNQSFTEQFE